MEQSTSNSSQTTSGSSAADQPWPKSVMDFIVGATIIFVALGLIFVIPTSIGWFFSSLQDHFGLQLTRNPVLPNEYWPFGLLMTVISAFALGVAYGFVSLFWSISWSLGKTVRTKYLPSLFSRRTTKRK